MKKIAIAVLSVGAFAAVAALGTSYYVGQQLQQAFEQTTQTWSSDDGFSVHLQSYQRGWVRSQATTLWTFSDEENTYDLLVSHDIVHGPWAMGHAATIRTEFALPDGSEAELVEALQGQSPLTWDTRVAWSGTTAHVLHSPDFSVQFEDASSLSWGGLQAQWSLSAERDAIQGQLYLPKLQVHVDTSSRMELENAHLRFNTRIPGTHVFWEGPFEFSLGRIAVHEPESGTAIDLQDMHVHSNSQMDKELVHLNLQARVAQLNVQNQPAKDWQLDASFVRVDAAWLDQLILWLQAGPQAEEHQLALLERLPQFFGANPELSIRRLGMTTVQGPAEITAKLGYIGQQPEHFIPASDLLGFLRAQLPQPLLEQFLGARVQSDYLALLEQLGNEITEEQLAASVQDGVGKRLQTLLENQVLERDGQQLKADLQFDQQGFRLNGRATDLQSLLSLGDTF